MPKVNKQAVLELDDVRKAIEIAKKRDAFHFALIAWMYEQGARASEPGMQRVKDVDVRSGRAQIVHLKQKPRETKTEVRPAVANVMLLKFCREALPPWLKEKFKLHTLPEQQDVLFPSRRPHACETCKGTGKWHHTRKKVVAVDACFHCGATGKRWGLDRFEVGDIVGSVLKEAGVPEDRRHPHVFRHSLVTHLLEQGVQPKVIQDRVGHTQLATTLGYVNITKTAASAIENAMAGIYGEEKQ